MKTKRAVIQSLMLIGLVATMTVVPTLSAQAHSGEESYVYLQIFDDTIEGEVHYPVVDLNEVLGLTLDPESPSFEDDVRESLADLNSYTVNNLSLELDGEVWPLRPTGYHFVERDTYVSIDFEVDQTFDPMPRVFEVEYTAIVNDKPERSALLIIGTDWRSGTFNNEGEHLLVFSDGDTQKTVDLGDTSFFKGVLGTIGLGAEHIQIGFDHILFIIALVLPSVLVFTRPQGWVPTPTFGSGLWRVVKIATSFTIAHTITLTLGGLGFVELSPDLVEPMIAISIALAAWHNIRPLFFNKEWALAFAFGLFHGFGFAGLLADLGLDRSNRIMSLLGFNIGIELGQIAIILLVFPSLFLLRRTSTYVKQMVAGSVALIVISLGWFFERVFDLDLGVSWVVDRLLVWPRPLYLAALLGVYAVGYWYWEKSRNRLIPIETPPSDDETLVGVG